MPLKKEPQPAVYELMWEIRKFTRNSLLLQHVIAQHMGLHVTDAECIDFLQEMGPSTAGDLAKATGLTTGAITNVIDRLERSGFVKRSRHPTDRRKVIVSFLPEKHAQGKVHYTALAGAVQELLVHYTAKELQLLVEHTRALAEIYQTEVRRLEKAPEGG